MTKFAGEYAIYGQMEGDIFLRNSHRSQTRRLDYAGRCTGKQHAGRATPAGEKRPILWQRKCPGLDRTGRGLRLDKYFSHNDKADVTLNAILGYDPAIPHWGYNGSARRYWDFIFGASHQYSRIRRQLHHYGSGLNAIPVLSEYRDHPDDFYLLRIGYAGTIKSSLTSSRASFPQPSIRSLICSALTQSPVTTAPTSSAMPGTRRLYVAHHRNLGGLRLVEISRPKATW